MRRLVPLLTAGSLALGGCGLLFGHGGKAPAPKPITETLSGVVTNLDSSGQYLDADFTLQFLGTASQWTQDLPKVQEAVVGVIRGETANALSGSAGQQTLAQAVQKSLLAVHVDVTQVYVTKMVVD